MRLPDKLTPLTPAQAIAAMAEAYAQLFTREVDTPTLTALSAKSALESGHWRAVHRHNAWNIKGAHPVTGAYVMFPCDELLPPVIAAADLRNTSPREAQYGDGPCAVKTGESGGRVRVYFYPPHPQCIFRAWDSHVSAAVDYLAFLALDTTPDNGKPNRFAKAWRAVDELDDPDAFARELGKAGYYTADIEQYTAVVLSCYRRYYEACERCVAERALTPKPISTAPLVNVVPAAPDADEERVRGLVAMTLAESARSYFDHGGIHVRLA